MTTGPADPLLELAARAGVDLTHDGWRGEATAAAEPMCAILRALGHDVRAPDDAAAALAADDRAFWAAGAPPVLVDWDGAGADLPLRVAAEPDGAWEVEVAFESGRREHLGGRLHDLAADGHVWPGGLGHQVHCLRHVRLPGAELGYHDVSWRAPARRAGRA